MVSCLQKSVSLTEELSQVKAEAEEAKEAVESLKADIARRDMQADKGKSTDQSLSQRKWSASFMLVLGSL